jgi:phosphatidylglycerophosphate synthase
MMRKELLQELRKLPNLFTLSRLLLIPVLWFLAIKGFSVYLGIGLVVAGLTDSIDGFLARRLNLQSEFGSQFDSLADNILGPSAVFWLLMLEPSVYLENKVISLVGIFLYLVMMVVAWTKFRRFANLHLYSSKVSGTLLVVFVAHTFIFEGYNQDFFLFVVIVSILAIIELLVLLLTQDRVDEHMGSVVRVYLMEKRMIDSVD